MAKTVPNADYTLYIIHTPSAPPPRWLQHRRRRWRRRGIILNPRFFDFFFFSFFFPRVPGATRLCRTESLLLKTLLIIMYTMRVLWNVYARVSRPSTSPYTYQPPCSWACAHESTHRSPPISFARFVLHTNEENNNNNNNDLPCTANISTSSRGSAFIIPHPPDRSHRVKFFKGLCGPAWSITIVIYFLFTRLHDRFCSTQIVPLSFSLSVLVGEIIRKMSLFCDLF